MDTLDSYKKAVKNKYEEVKYKEYSDYLLNPSPAKLKRMCVLIFENTTADFDLAIFKKFFNFNESEDKIKQIRHFDTDKFRPFQNFLLKNTDISQTESIDLIAVLVNFEPRPYRKFRNNDCFEVINNRKNELTVQQNAERILAGPEYVSGFEIVKNWSLKNKILIGTLSVLIFASLGYSFKRIFFPTKNGIVWTKDHFVAVDLGDLRNIENAKPMNQVLLDSFRKITVCDTTTFFKNGDKDKPLVWYCKDSSTGELDYFNQPGLHPISGKTLKKITPYIINKYIRLEK